MDLELRAKLMRDFRINATSHDHTPRPEKIPGLNQLVDQSTKGGNHIFFGEPHVEGLAIRQYEILANHPEIFKTAAANGVKHLALEFPYEFQENLDNYTSGKISRDEFRNTLADFDSPWIQGESAPAFREVMTQTIDNARNAGMKIHFADVTATKILEKLDAAQLPDELRPIVDELTKSANADPNGPTAEDRVLKYINDSPPEKLSSWKKEITDKTAQIMTERLDDTEQYLYLRSRIPATEGIMGVVGHSHLDNHLDGFGGKNHLGIDDFLEQEGRKVTTVELQNGKTKAFQDARGRLDNLPQNDPPDYIINADENKIYIGDDMNTPYQPSAPKPVSSNTHTPAMSGV